LIHFYKRGDMFKNSWLLLFLVLGGSRAAYDSINKDIVIKSIDRTVDLSSQLVKIHNKISISFTGASGAPKSFLFALEGEAKDKLNFIGASQGSAEKTYLRVSETKVQGHSDKGFWKVELKDALTKGTTATVNVEIVLGGAQEMFPAAITQKEKQLVRYMGNVYAYSPYPVNSQTTSVTLASSNIESYTKQEPVSVQDSSVKYGPYNNVAAFTASPLVVHAENNNPMLVVTNLIRVLELSMWGNIAVEETVDVRHNGAQLKGSFSRYEYQRESSGVSSVKNFKTLLPAAAKDVYYRDDIGNISTSHMKVMDDAVELDLRPRFPLFGGWKTHYVVGYNVPSYEYLYYKGDKHVLNIRLVDHLFDDMLIENAEVRVILPEGVTDIELSTPYPVKREKDGKHYTYLDTTGRTVVVIRSIGDLTEQHIQNFSLQFQYSHTSMLMEPLLLISAFFLLFLLSIIYVRLDFSIRVDEGAEAKMKVAGYLEKVANQQDRRNGLYQAMEDAMIKFKSSKDNNSFQASLKRIAAEHKNDTQAISELMTTVKNINTELGDKVGELQRLDRVYRDYQTQQASLVEKLVSGKMVKAAYLDQENSLVKKKEETVDKINSLVRAF
jgi:oligosaccharyltransferase complex subunit alpha (ribophorin I)